MHRFFAPGAAAVLSFMTGVALAGTATISSTDGGSAIFEYSDTMLRIGTDDPTGYAVVRDGSMYVVSTANGVPLVMDTGAMMRGLAGAGAGMSQMAPADLDAEFVGLENTGRKETVAGIVGEVYVLTTRDDSGSEQTDEIVLSSDPRAREFLNAMYLMVDTLKDAASQQTLAHSKEIKVALDKMDAGILRFGDDMVVTAIDDGSVDAARFELPAAPMSLEGLGGMLGNMGGKMGGTQKPPQ